MDDIEALVAVLKVDEHGNEYAELQLPLPRRAAFSRQLLHEADGTFLTASKSQVTVRAANATATYRLVDGDHPYGWREVIGELVPRCDRCGNFLSICGHDLPFSERAKSVNAQRLWAGTL